MDLLVTKLDGKTTKLSALGAQVYNFQESAPTISRTSKSFDGRNGSLDYGARHTDKKIKVSILLTANQVSGDNIAQQQINALLSQINPYYITKIDGDDLMYDFERPGQKKGDLSFSGGAENNKRFKVYRTDTNVPDFQGKTGNKLISIWDLEFETVGLPYGESKPRDVTVTSGQSIQYNGTAACSQLEQAFYFVVKAKVANANGFTLKLDTQTLEINSPVVVGDVFTLSGMNNVRGNQNINDKTNAGYFVLNPSATNKLTCSIDADIQLKNLIDLYV